MKRRLLQIGLGSALGAMGTSTPAYSTNVCEQLIQNYETRHGIPKNLLKAISRVESGRYLPGVGTVAWPWTINANGIPYVFETKAEAIAKVQELQKQGISSIDVGCMQINLKHHPTAFANLDEAFDPAKNIEYAIEFLLQKKKSQGTWHDAVGHYHSATAALNAPYKARVLKSLASIDETSPAQTLFNLHNTGDNAVQERRSHFYSFTGRRVPVRVRFSSYGPQAQYKPTVMRYGKLKSTSSTGSLHRDTPIKTSSYTPKIYKKTPHAKGRFFRLKKAN